MIDSDLILINKTDLDSGTDGTGSGTDETASGGAVVEPEEEALVGIVAFIKPSDTAGEPGDADTLAITVEVAADGTNYGQLCKFRSILGSEAPDDTGAGDKTLRLATIARLPRSTVAGTRTVKVRGNTTASDTSNWGLYLALVDPNSIRTEWMDDALEA